MASVHKCELVDLYKDLGVDVYSKCPARSTRSQYAALDAHIEHIELPTISSETPCGAYSIPNHCIKPETALKLSVIALIGTYVNCTNLLFFVTECDQWIDFIKRISNVRRSRLAPTTTAIEKINDHSYSIISFDTGRQQVVSENEMLSIAATLASSSMSLTLYLDSSFILYAARVQRSPVSVWASTMCFNPSAIGRTATRVMPLMFAEPHINHVLRINVGLLDISLSNEDRLQNQIYATLTRVMSGVSKDGLCFCCAYLKRVHSIFCSRVEPSPYPLKIGLEDQFFVT